MVNHIILRDALLGRSQTYLCLIRSKTTFCKSFLRSASTATNGRQRRQDVWIPTVNVHSRVEDSDATQLLIRAGYLRQAYSGIFHLLPLGLRVQEKLEVLIDKHMRSIGASKVSLSSISSQKLWARSGRLEPGTELFKFQDRRGSKWLLAPTHEEEITNLAKDVVHSSSQIPIRLYQISRKYRDEKRPRGGLLRGREFIMKDLYTFDITPADAHVTYDTVRQAYRNLFDELSVPYVEARADSGNMGGSLSHEYHFPSLSGEDDIINCDSCDYARNEEWVPQCSSKIDLFDPTITSPCRSEQTLVSLTFTDHSKTSLVKAFAPQKSANGEVVALNPFAIKAAMDHILQLDTGIEKPRLAFLQTINGSQSDQAVVYYLFDPSIDGGVAQAEVLKDKSWLAEHRLTPKLITLSADAGTSFSLLKQSAGDSCPQCSEGKLQVTKAIEVGHTFHLGTRYSEKLGLTVKREQNDANFAPVEMGCHGIGVSRLVAATASALSDQTGLNWPAAIAPYQIVIIVDGKDQARLIASEKLYDSLSHSADVLLDDRSNVSNGYKLKDADMIGYPIIVVVGRAFTNGQVEIQCRTRSIKTTVDTRVAPQEVMCILDSLSK